MLNSSKPQSQKSSISFPFTFQRKNLVHIQRVAQSILIALAIVFGVALHQINPSTASEVGTYSDWTILLLLSLLLFEIRIPNLRLTKENSLIIALSLLVNFIITPILAYAISSLFFEKGSLIFIGLMIYFIAPCTDWFLGFTKIAGGNTSLGSTLIPINMAIQLLLYPYLMYVIGHQVLPIDVNYIGSTIMDWFILPLAIAIGAKLIMHFVIKEQVATFVSNTISHLIPLVIAALVFFIFASNSATLFDGHTFIFTIGLAIFTFFVANFIITELISRGLNISHKNHVLFSMTTTARNAPLMLAVTLLAFPDQPLIYAALIIGMLIEFPHLIALSFILTKTTKK